jgi:predicted permease
MVLGFLLKRRGFIDDVFTESGTKVLFYVALPCLLFLNIMQSNLTEAFDAPLTLLSVGGMLVFVVLLRLITPHFIKNVASSSAFIQACFRSNYVLLGLPFINNLVGPPGLAKAGTIMAFTIPLFNVLAVLILAENQQQGGSRMHMLFQRIITNPLIIATVLGIIGSFLPFNLPVLLERPLSTISDMAMPLALFTLGASLHIRGEVEKLRLALAASLIKLIIAPLAAVLIACRLGFDPIQIAVTLAIFAAPPAVACFPMAFQMGADHQLASMTIVLGTGLSALTMFAFVYALRLLGLV